MKISGIIQTAILLILLASAASCEVSREYLHRTFHKTTNKKSDSLTLKFMQPDTLNASNEKDFTVIKNETIISKPDSDPVVEKNKTYVIPQTTGTVRTKRKRTSSL
jgi:hypothetical protein